MDLNEFKKIATTLSMDDVMDELILSDGAAHVSNEAFVLLRGEISKTFSVDAVDVSVFIVGSAKLGFSMVKKKTKEGHILPRFRSYSADSDIDVAVVSPNVYKLIWDELCEHAHGQPWFPWDSDKLGDYMVYGWLRPDWFPASAKLISCNKLWEMMRRLSNTTEFQRRKVRVALYHSHYNLRQYQLRGLKDCISAIKEAV